MSLKIEATFKTQTELQHHISRIVENLKKLGKDKITLLIIDTWLKALEPSWKNFQTAHIARIHRVQQCRKIFTFWKIQKGKSFARSHAVTTSKCCYCIEDHYILRCLGFNRKSLTERHEFVRANDLCFNYLGLHKRERMLYRKMLSSVQWTSSHSSLQWFASI